MVDRSDEEEIYNRDLNVVKKARFNPSIELNLPKETPAKAGERPHSRVKELPVQPVREFHQDNMLQQHQDNMLQDNEVVSFGQRAQQQQDQQQLQLRQDNIPHNPVDPKHNPTNATRLNVNQTNGIDSTTGQSNPGSTVIPFTDGNARHAHAHLGVDTRDDVIIGSGGVELSLTLCTGACGAKHSP